MTEATSALDPSGDYQVDLQACKSHRDCVKVCDVAGAIESTVGGTSTARHLSHVLVWPSAFSTAMPSGFKPSINSAFAAAMFSIDPRYSRWTGATINSTATSGGVIRHSRWISCVGDDMPISNTARSN